MNIIYINIGLLCLICVLALAHRGAGRSAALIYATLMVGQAVIADRYSLEGFDYFKVCGVFQTIIIIMICSISAYSRLTDILVTISIATWFTNLTAAFMWSNNISLDPYYYTCTILYIISATTMLWEDGHHATGRGFVPTLFRSLGYPGFTVRRTIHGAAE